MKTRNKIWIAIALFNLGLPTFADLHKSDLCQTTTDAFIQTPPPRHSLRNTPAPQKSNTDLRPEAPIIIYKDPSLHLKEEIGEGNYGKVWRAERVKNGLTTQWALKRAKGDSLNNEFQNLKWLGREAYFVRHDGVIYLATPFISADPINAPTHRAPTLEDLRENLSSTLYAADKKIRWAYIRTIRQSLAQQLSEIHRRGMIHVDFKAANILVSQKGLGGINIPVPHLSDFGMAKPFGSAPLELNPLGSPHTMGVEAWVHPQNFSPRRDAEALATTLLEDLYLAPLHHQAEQTKDLLEIKKDLVFNPAHWTLSGKIENFHRTGPARVYDNVPQLIPPTVALVLAGRVARSPEQLSQLLDRAEDAFNGNHSAREAFNPFYAKEWTRAYRDALHENDIVTIELLQYGLLASPNLGPKIFKHLEKPLQKNLIETARNWRGWIANPRIHAPAHPAIEVLGRHPFIDPLLKEFLTKTRLHTPAP